MKLAFGSDHAAFELRKLVADYARSKGYEVDEFGAQSNEPYDCPDAADEVCHRILAGEYPFGVLLCGTGIGITIRANRYRGIRAANCTSVLMAELARQHNDANILGLGARILTVEEAVAIFDAFFATSPSTEPRHMNRVTKLDHEVGE